MAAHDDVTQFADAPYDLSDYLAATLDVASETDYKLRSVRHLSSIGTSADARDRHRLHAL